MLLLVYFKGTVKICRGCFTFLVVLGGSGIDSSALGIMGEIKGLENSLLYSYFPLTSTALCWLLQHGADLLVMITAFILELNYSSNFLSQEENTVTSYES